MNLVEAGIGTTGEETVELVIIKKMTLIKARFAYLYKKKQVRVLALWCCAVTLLDVVGCNIDTLHMIISIIFANREDDEFTILVVAGLGYLLLVSFDGGLMNCAVLKLGSSSA